MYFLAVFCLFFFFFNDTATTEIYTLSLHDALPISSSPRPITMSYEASRCSEMATRSFTIRSRTPLRSEEHTSELQSQSNLVCRLLLEKKKKQRQSGSSTHYTYTAACIRQLRTP